MKGAERWKAHSSCAVSVGIFFFFCSAGFLVVERAFFTCSEWGLLSTCGVRASHYGGFSCFGAWTLEHRLSSCGTWTLWLTSMWDLPGSGVELCLLHWQADSLPLSHQGSPEHGFCPHWETKNSWNSTAIFSFRQWSGREPLMASRYACTHDYF